VRAGKYTKESEQQTQRRENGLSPPHLPIYRDHVGQGKVRELRRGGEEEIKREEEDTSGWLSRRQIC